MVFKSDSLDVRRRYKDDCCRSRLFSWKVGFQKMSGFVLLFFKIKEQPNHSFLKNLSTEHE